MSTLDRSGQTALYLQLAEKLMDDIQAKRLLPLEKLPSEYELTRVFDVSRVTVRQAIKMLSERGLVVSRQGKGVFVSGPNVSQDLNSLRGMYDSLLAQGHEPETEIIQFTPSSHHTVNDQAQTLGDAVHFTRVYRVNNAVVVVAEATVSSFGTEITRDQIERYPVYGLLHEIVQRKVNRAQTSIKAARSPDSIAELLSLGEESLSLQMERKSYDENGVVLERTQFHIQPEIFAFELEVSGPMQIASGIKKLQ